MPIVDTMATSTYAEVLQYFSIYPARSLMSATIWASIASILVRVS